VANTVEMLAPGFLIAAPMLRDRNFERTVVLMCIHNEDGAMGLVINRPAPLSIRDILVQLNLDCAVDGGQSILVGGPVAPDSGLLLYEVAPEAEQKDDELSVSSELRLCPNRDLLQEIGRGSGPDKYHMFLGHSGWGPGQLEAELSQGAWIPTQLRMDLIFGVPFDRRWEEALRAEGMSPAQFGHNRPSA
jgi:putative transcriptional regulator